MDLFFWYDGMVYFHIEGHMILFSNKIVISLRIVFILTNSVDATELPHNVGFLLGLRCLRKHAFSS